MQIATTWRFSRLSERCKGGLKGVDAPAVWVAALCIQKVSVEAIGGIQLRQLIDDQRPILFVHGENAHSRYFSETAYAAASGPKELLIIPGASHVDLYDRVDVIPFDKFTEFFRANLK